MSRSGYIDDCDQWDLIRWRGAVASSIRGKRGQAFLRELVTALDALPEKKLIAEELEIEGQVCALGAVGRARGLDMAGVDPGDHDTVASVFQIPHALACEIMWENDEQAAFFYYGYEQHADHVVAYWKNHKAERRWQGMRAWAVKHLKSDAPPPPSERVEHDTGETKGEG